MQVLVWFALCQPVCCACAGLIRCRHARTPTHTHTHTHAHTGTPAEVDTIYNTIFIMHSNCFLFSLSHYLPFLLFIHQLLRCTLIKWPPSISHSIPPLSLSPYPLCLSVKHLQHLMSHEMFQLPAADNDEWPWARLTASTATTICLPTPSHPLLPSLSLAHTHSSSVGLFLFIVSSMLAKLICLFLVRSRIY